MTIVGAVAVAGAGAGAGAGAKFALSGISLAIQTLYGVVGEMNTFIDKHIEEMKASDNTTISRTGKVIEGAKYGFGLGYMVPVAIIAVGQLLLGNQLAAIKTVITTATFTNPIAMTCAAVGAIYYGWRALSDAEQNEILETLSKGLEVGIELIKAVIRFVVDTTKEIFSSKNFDELKNYISSAAAVFGKTVGDVTHKISDVVSDTFDTCKKMSGEALDKTVTLASEAYDTVKTKAGKEAGETLGTRIKLKFRGQTKTK